MKRFIEGEDRKQITLLPECLDDYVGADNPVRIVDVFVDQLKLRGLGFTGVEPADFEKLQSTHKLTTPLTIAVQKDGPPRYQLNKEAAVTVLVYKAGGKIFKNFAFADTKSASDKAKDIAAAAEDALK